MKKLVKNYIVPRFQHRGTILKAEIRFHTWTQNRTTPPKSWRDFSGTDVVDLVNEQQSWCDFSNRGAIFRKIFGNRLCL